MLGVCLMEFNEGGVIVQNSFMSSLVIEVKNKKDSYPIWLQLKDAVDK